MNSGDANGLRACEGRDAVQYTFVDGDFRRLRAGASCSRVLAREHLEAVHRLRGEQPAAGAAVLLPLSAAELGNRIDRFVAPCGARRGRPQASGAFARRDARRSAACRDRGIARLRVVCSITANGIKPLDGPDLIKQVGQDITVGDILAAFTVVFQTGAEEHLNDDIAVDARSAAHGCGIGRSFKFCFSNPHRRITQIDQAGGVGRPISGAIATIGPPSFVRVRAHLIDQKSIICKGIRIVKAAPYQEFSRVR
ncbi:Uncharacterised protein [Burkholderia pseudomallei]|nr:Uncharacterised protein [Burkholderia pseudomallei]